MSIDVFPATVLNSTLWNGQSMPLPITGGGTGATTAATARTNLGLGTMAQQDANAVAITGGTAKLSHFEVGNIINGAVRQAIEFDKSGGGHGLVIHGSGADTGGYHALFFNAAASIVGTISTTASATAYNTSSDARLKHAIVPLSGALDVVTALRPVAFRWNADDSVGHGFLAHELQQVIPEAVSGEPDAVGPQGEIVPQQVDHSKLIPWLTAALQEAVAQVQALTARVQSLEEQLGV